jgi:hypothetical protein
MPKIQIHTDTFIAGKPAFRGEVHNVDKNVAGDLILAEKAYELKPGEVPRIPEIKHEDAFRKAREDANKTPNNPKDAAPPSGVPNTKTPDALDPKRGEK